MFLTSQFANGEPPDSDNWMNFINYNLKNAVVTQ